MAKVDFPEGNYLNPAAYTQTGTGKLKRKAALKRTPFSHIMENAGEAAAAEALPAISPSEEALQGLLDDVHSAGDTLKLRPFQEEIKQYKRAVRNFMYYVVENGYGIKEETYLLNRRKHIKVQVEVIDRKLEQLAAGIMAGQINQLELLAKVDEITGILVNLLQ
ncbi:MAG: YaaR family protein [Treponema sp.]|jgi:uncharacterized protein YaaR (DUF327 family)|nr:YaaR family protein [Treponema sp.]